MSVEPFFTVVKAGKELLIPMVLTVASESMSGWTDHATKGLVGDRAAVPGSSTDGESPITPATLPFAKDGDGVFPVADASVTAEQSTYGLSL